MLKHRFLGLGFGLICCLALTTLGFSTWIVGNKQSNETGDVNAGVGGLENQDVITFVSSNEKLFEITKDGLVFDSTYVNSAEITYTFDLNNIKFPEVNVAKYEATFVMKNVAEIFKSNFAGSSLNGTSNEYNLNNLSQYLNRSYTYKESISVDLNKSSADKKTRFNLSYKFSSDSTNNIFNNITGDLNLKLTLKQIV